MPTFAFSEYRFICLSIPTHLNCLERFQSGFQNQKDKLYPCTISFGGAQAALSLGLACLPVVELESESWKMITDRSFGQGLAVSTEKARGAEIIRGAPSSYPVLLGYRSKAILE